MSARPKGGRRRPFRVRGISVWLIALLVALVATVQIRSQAEVERSLVGTDPTSLAFLIDDLHRANDSLDTEKAHPVSQRPQLQSGHAGPAHPALTRDPNLLRPTD